MNTVKFKNTIMNYKIHNHILSIGLGLFLLACVPIKPDNQPDVHALSSNQIIFSNISSKTTAKGLMIAGNVKKNATASKRVNIPGHIHIILKTKNNKPLEIVTARTHRQYGNSSLWHFDGVLTQVPPEGSTVIVQYHGKHN